METLYKSPPPHAPNYTSLYNSGYTNRPNIEMSNDTIFETPEQKGCEVEEFFAMKKSFEKELD